MFKLSPFQCTLHAAIHDNSTNTKATEDKQVHTDFQAVNCTSSQIKLPLCYTIS